MLLFELISFGGEPYPNINPQMVQKYLEDGHRLSAPEHCDEDMYVVLLATLIITPVFQIQHYAIVLANECQQTTQFPRYP